jgi:ABC-type multidrug transport system fused ATPase/permease subunit
LAGGDRQLRQLLLRVYEAQEGKVTYGDLNIDRVDITTTASGTRQDIRGFEGTLRENIVCGLGELPMGEPSDEQLFAVAKLVGLIGTMEAKQSLPQGLDTKVRCPVAASLKASF